jgi:N-acyl homoserine lactone hydrolase
MSATYTITPLDLGRATRDKSFFTYMTDMGRELELAIISFLVRSAEHTVLVDTGGSRMSQTAAWHLPYEQREDQTLGAQLRRHEVDPGDVDAVIYTHLHWDHAYNAELLTSARFFTSRRELEFAKDPCPIQDRLYDAPGTGHHTPYLDIDFDFTEPDREIVPGISVLPTPGHSPGHQSVLVPTASGTAIVTGDVVPLEENWLRQVPNGMLHNLEEHYESFARLKHVGGHIVASHDLRTLERGPFPADAKGGRGTGGSGG